MVEEKRLGRLGPRLACAEIWGSYSENAEFPPPGCSCGAVGLRVACLTLTGDSSAAFSIGSIRALWAGQGLAVSVGSVLMCQSSVLRNK